MTTLPLEDLKAVRRAFGTTLNDVFLTVCSGAVRGYLLERNALPARPLVASVPLSTAASSPRKGGNHVDNIYVTISTDEADPVERLRHISAVARGAKEMRAALGTDLLEERAEIVPPQLYSLAIRAWTRSKLADRTRPPVNLVLSNVPGPPTPLHMGSANLIAIYSVGPILEGIGCNITAWSYGANLHVSVLGCPRSLPDPWPLAEALPGSLAELVAAAGVPGTRRFRFVTVIEGGLLPGAERDPAFLRRARPVLERFAAYFRSEVRGFDGLPPKGPFLVVANHSGGQIPPDLPVLFTAWWRERGEDERVYALFHSFFLGLPAVGRIMARAGAIEASPDAAEEILRSGGILIDFPGGDYEVFRPWWERNRIEFGGRLGFVRLALRTGVPVVPAVSIGGQETLVVLARGERVARWLHIDRIFRIKVMPLVAGPPFGIVPGGIPTWPLPSKITVELGEPIDWSDRYGPETADDEAVLRACYDELVRTMQSTLDRLSAERRFPVLG